MTIPELFGGGIPGRTTDATSAEVKAELHARVVSVFSLPVLAILATPLALIGQGRGGRAGGIVIAVVVFIAYEKLTGLGKVMAGKGGIDPLIGLWTPWFVLLLFTGLMFHRYSGDSWRGVFDLIAGLTRKSVKPGPFPAGPVKP